MEHPPWPALAVAALVVDFDPDPPRDAGVGDVEGPAFPPGRRMQQRVGGRLADQQHEDLSCRVGLLDGGRDELAGEPDLAGLADKPVQPANLRHRAPPCLRRLTIDQAQMALEQAASARRDPSMANTTIPTATAAWAAPA
jgi:hypothetical protein